MDIEVQRVKVVNKGDSWLGTEYYIDENKVNNVKSVDFHVAFDEVPAFTFETCGLPDIDMPGSVQFSFTPETVQQAAVVLQNEFKNNAELRKALVVSIVGVLKELPKEIGLYDVAENVADRIVGLEK